MHILFLSDNFPPEVNAPASRTFEHCREWVRAGHRVTVITCVPNFPIGKVFEGYSNRLFQREEMAGIHIIRVWSYIAANEGFSKRVMDYLSFMLSAVVAAAFVRKVDIVIGTSPQFFTACAAYLVAAIKRVSWVFELRDIWPESIRAVGAMRQSRMLDLLEKIELFLYRKSSAIVTVTHAFRDTLISRGVDGDKIKVVTNGVDLGRFQPRAKDGELLARHGLNGKFVAGYIGTHGMAHALDTLLDVARTLKSTQYRDLYRIVLLGDGSNKVELMARAKEEDLDNVIFVNTVPKDEVARYWSLLDVSVIHLKKTELFKTVIPSKLFESMGMGIPVLHGVQGESARIVESENVGLVFEPENANSLIQHLCLLAEDQDLYAQIRANGPLAALRYDRASLASEMVNYLEVVKRKAEF